MSDEIKISELDFDIESLSDNNMEFDASSSEEQEFEFETTSGIPIPVEGVDYGIGEGLSYDSKTNELSVDMANEVKQDLRKPVSSAAVHEAIIGETYSILTSRENLATNIDIDNLFK